MSTLRHATPLDVSKLVFVGALWGASFIFITLALNSFGPLSIAAWRITIAAVVLLIISRLTGQLLPLQFKDWIKMAQIGVLNSALPFFLIGWGMQYISSAEAALLMASGTFFALILSHFSSTDERFNVYRASGVAIGFAGVFTLVITELLESGTGALKGQLAVMTAGFSYATSSVMSRRIMHLPSLSAAGCVMLTASIYMLPIAFVMEEPLPTEADPAAIAAIAQLGLLATALAYVIRLHIIRHNGAIFMSLVGYLIPLFGVIWSWLFLAETLATQTLVALATILLGIAVTRQGTKDLQPLVSRE